MPVEMEWRGSSRVQMLCAVDGKLVSRWALPVEGAWRGYGNGGVGGRLTVRCWW